MDNCGGTQFVSWCVPMFSHESNGQKCVYTLMIMQVSIHCFTIVLTHLTKPVLKCDHTKM